MQQFISDYLGSKQAFSVQALPGAGSDRRYTRVTYGEQSMILCESANVAENETFVYFTEFFQKQHIRVPGLLAISPDRKMYLLEDLGDLSLLDLLLKDGYTQQVKQLYRRSLSALVDMQIAGGMELDFTKCFASQRFDALAVRADLNYFKYYFLDLVPVPYNRIALRDEFEQLEKAVGSIASTGFMYRDFQGRNIMVKNGEPCFIDYQGGMQGPLQYDVASLLWQAKAALPAAWKQELYQQYKRELAAQHVFDEQQFDAAYRLIVLARLLQVLGAYGLRGLIEQKNHFRQSIPMGLRNIREWMQQFPGNDYPELQQVLIQLSSDDMIRRFDIPTAGNDTALTVRVSSFSYKAGIPEDGSGNGGGFVFDCRGILNPGRFEEYKKLTGRDRPVIDFLQSRTRIREFLANAMAMVDIAVEDYMNRGFEHLMISFGCTGGQHRSVYCADMMARHLKEKYGLSVQLKHHVQDAKNWVNG